VPVTVKEITAQQHLAFVNSLPSASFLQVPSWAGVKAEWGHINLGWFEGDALIGTGLVLTRQVPKTKFFLAYLPEGPVLPWNDGIGRAAVDLLPPMLAYLKRAGAFMVKLGPTVADRRRFS
jgi:lipid II:glycine glycyltransferase (peptidoglycan interpeptide bridge formation enzyme)